MQLIFLWLKIKQLEKHWSEDRIGSSYVREVNENKPTQLFPCNYKGERDISISIQDKNKISH